MREQLDELQARRGARGSGGPRSAAAATAAGDEPLPLFHTTFHISLRQRVALINEATRRQSEALNMRNDKSAVVRDVLDWWIENADAFTEWQRARRR